MDCKEFSNLLDAWMNGELSDAEAAQMQAHANTCENCAAELLLRRDCRGMDEEITAPESFQASWRQKIREEAEMEEKPVEKKNKSSLWKKYLAAAAALVFVVGGTLLSRDSYPRSSTTTQEYSQNSPAALAASGKRAAQSSYTNFAYEAPAAGAYEMMYEDEMAMDMDMEAPSAEEAANGQDFGANSGREEKIIRTASFTIKTTAFDQDMEALKNLCSSLGGRVEYLSSSGEKDSGQLRTASLTLRIPSQRLDEFLLGSQSIGSVTSMTQEMQDVSDSYYDVSTRLNTQKEKMKRLQSMMESAVRMTDLIEIESAIAETQYQIDRYTGQLQSYDSKVNYSTVRVSVRESRATEIVSLSLGQRIWGGLQNSLSAGLDFLQDMVIFLCSVLPWLIAVGAAALVIRLIVKKRKNKKEGQEK